MVEYNNERNLDLVFHALADTTRRSLLRQLSTKEYRVTDLAAQYDMSLNSVSKHLKVLERAQLIERNIVGRVHLCKMNSNKLKDIEAWMEPYKKFWERSLDQLEDYMQSKKGDRDE